MRLPGGHHLAYCTNIHPGETWPEVLATLETHALAVRDRVGAGRPYAIGLRLGDQAARELSEPAALLHFQRWLETERCYVFTINGFPFGRFHGSRVKEQVYLPDWTSPGRVEYTKRLFDLLAQLLPAGVSGSVSTSPGSFKEFIRTREQAAAMRRNLHECVTHIAEVSARTGRELCLGLEPEPLGFLETTAETVEFMERLREEYPGDARLAEFLGVNYDTCHLAVEFEEAVESLGLLQERGIKVCKIHLSNALRVLAGGVLPNAATLLELRKFADDTYLHQVVSRDATGVLTRYRDLGDFLAAAAEQPWVEARIHFHVPLHAAAGAPLQTTQDHLFGALDALQRNPALCSHLEMETYTWGVLPPEMKSRSVVDQLTAEYQWCLGELKLRGLA